MKIYALANELKLDRPIAGQIVVPFGTWDYGELQKGYRIDLMTTV